MKKDSKLFKILINLDIVIASIALVILVGCTFAGVIARYVVGKPFGWIEEIQAAFIVWVVFAAGGAAYRTGNHSAIEILYEIFPNRLTLTESWKCPDIPKPTPQVSRSSFL